MGGWPQHILVKEMTLPRCRTLHFLLVIFRRFLSDPFCSLARSLWMQHIPLENQPGFPICKCAEGGPCPPVMGLWNWTWCHPQHKTCATDQHTLNSALQPGFGPALPAHPNPVQQLTKADTTTALPSAPGSVISAQKMTRLIRHDFTFPSPPQHLEQHLPGPLEVAALQGAPEPSGLLPAPWPHCPRGDVNQEPLLEGSSSTDSR